MPKRGSMFRIIDLRDCVRFCRANRARPSFRRSRPPVASPMMQGTHKERDACHPDVKRYCQAQLQVNPDDVLGILGCLQTNRSKISQACQQVLASHGQ